MEILLELQTLRGNNKYLFDGHVHFFQCRIACAFWMFVGVFIYSFIIGSLASLVSSLDIQQQQFSNKLNVLIQLKKEYNFDNALYLKIKNALKYGTKYLL